MQTILEAKYTIYFDGACKKMCSGGGFVVMEGGKVIDGRYELLDKEVKTNNKSEITSLLKALQYFQNKYTLPRGTALNVIGDSLLIINFLNRKCTPGDKYFV